MDEPTVRIFLQPVRASHSLESRMLIEHESHFIRNLLDISLQEDASIHCLTTIFMSALQHEMNVICQRAVDHTAFGVTFLEPRVTELDVDVAKRSRRSIAQQGGERHVDIARDVEQVMQARVGGDTVGLMHERLTDFEAEEIAGGMALRELEKEAALRHAEIHG